MPSRLAEVCRAGSACPSTLAHSTDPAPSRRDVYRPEAPASENGFLDVLSSVQTLILIAIAILALGLVLATTWSNRCEDRRRKSQGAQPPAPPER